MATLYEIDTAILNCIDEQTGEIIDENALDSLNIQREQKIENVALYYKNCLADAEMYKNEKMVFAEKQKRAENTAKSLKKYLEYALDGNEFETSKVSVSFRKSESVLCEDVFSVPQKYLRFPEPELNRDAIKKALKSGETVYGCSLQKNNNIQIK